MNVIVIPTYNTQEEHCNNIISLGKKFPNDIVYVVDNGEKDNPYQSKFLENNIIYEKSVFGGRYEPGALLQARNKFDANKYLLIQDSILINDEIFIKDYFEKDLDLFVCFQYLFPSYWFLTYENLYYLQSIIDNVEELLDKVFGYSHSSFLCEKKHVDHMINCGILSEKYLPRCKNEQQAWERLFGILISVGNFKTVAMSISGQPLNDEQKSILKGKHVLHLGRPLEEFFVKSHGNRA